MGFVYLKITTLRWLLGPRIITPLARNKTKNHTHINTHAERFDAATSTTGAIGFKSTPVQAGGCFTNAYCAEYADNADTLVMRHGVFRRGPESGYYYLKYPEVVLRNGDHGFVEGIMEVRRV